MPRRPPPPPPSDALSSSIVVVEATAVPTRPSDRLRDGGDGKDDDVVARPPVVRAVAVARAADPVPPPPSSVDSEKAATTTTAGAGAAAAAPSPCSNGDDATTAVVGDRPRPAGASRPALLRPSSSSDRAAPFPDNRRCTSLRTIGLWRLGFFLVLLREWTNDDCDGNGGGTTGGRRRRRRSGVWDAASSWFGGDDDDAFRASSSAAARGLDLEYDAEGGKFGVDRWFRYNHLSWVQDVDLYLQRNADKEQSDDDHPPSSSLGFFDLTHEAISKLGSACCLLAAAGGEGKGGTALVPWIVPSSMFAVLYAFRFFSTTASYSDRNYLHLLLLVLTVYSGGGSVLNDPTGQSRRRRCRRRRACETAAVAIRIQFAIVRFHSVLRKLDVDWLNGSVARGALLLLDRPERRGGEEIWGRRSSSSLGAFALPWRKIDEAFPAAFSIVAVCDLAVDATTFAYLTLRKPTRSDAGAMLAVTVVYQTVVRSLWFGGRIGGSIAPAVAVLGSLVCCFPFGVVEATTGGARAPPVATAATTNGSAIRTDGGVSDGAATTTTTTAARKKRRSKRGASREGPPAPSSSSSPAAVAAADPSSSPRDAIAEADASLLDWMKLYYAVPWSDSVSRALDRKPEVVVCVPTVRRRAFVYLWLAFQALLPMRSFFLGGGRGCGGGGGAGGRRSAYTGRATRFGWFDAAQTRSTGIVVRGGRNRRIVATMPLSYLVPSLPLAGGGDDDDGPFPGGGNDRVHVRRSSYLPQTSRNFEDDRTLPLSQVLGPRRLAATDERPGSLLAPVAAGMARIVDDRISSPPADDDDGGGSTTCRGGRVKVRATHFVRLNGRGPYVRVVDPTVDLVAVAAVSDAAAPGSSSSRPRRFSEWLDALLDRPSARNDGGGGGGGYLLGGNIGSGFLRAEAEGLERDLRRRFPGRSVNLVADRGRCLASSPLWLRPNGLPVRVVALRTPRGRSLTVTWRSAPTEEGDGVARTTALHPGSSSSGGGTVTAELSTEPIELEIGIGGGGGESSDDVDDAACRDAACRDAAEEDVLFALVL